MKKVLTFILLIVGTTALLSCGGNTTKSTADNSSQVTEKAVVNIENGQAVYNKVCIACHMTGVAGAAAITDKARWVEVAANGMDYLHNSVINGVPKGKYGVMPARGSCTDCSDQDLFDAVAYMLKEAGVEAK